MGKYGQCGFCGKKGNTRYWIAPFLRPIYAEQLCRMRYAYEESRTRVVSCKSNLQVACDCRVWHENCRGLLKHDSKPYDNRSDRQSYIVKVVYNFLMTRAAGALKIACDNLKQKSFRVTVCESPWKVKSPGVGGTPYNGLHEEALPQRGTFSGWRYIKQGRDFTSWSIEKGWESGHFGI